MAVKELFDGWKLDWNPTVQTATRAFQADYATWAADTPQFGEFFPRSTVLRLKNKHVEPLTVSTTAAEPDQVKVVCDYATYEYLDSAPTESGEVSAEVLEIGLGRIWESVGRPVQQAQGVVLPMMEWSVHVIMGQIPKDAIISKTGKCNYFQWRDFPPETLLYQGATWENRYDYERTMYIYSVTHKFGYRPIGWNTVWRAPEQARSEGNLVYDNDGLPVWVSGPAGIGGWDRILPKLYEWTDFNSLIGLPDRSVPVW